MAFSGYCKIEGIKGEATDDKHKDWIDLVSFNHGLSQTASMGGGRGGLTGQRADFSEFSIVKILDASTADLNKHCASGKHIKKIEVELCQAMEDQLVFMRYELEDCIITSVRPGGSPDGQENKPLEEVGIAYGKFKWKYTQYDHQGKKIADHEAGWDLEKNKSL